MGRIKTSMVKRATRELIASEGHPFNESFEHNKRILGNNTMPSKKVRNKIAGYIGRLERARKNPRVKKNDKIESIEQPSQF